MTALFETALPQYMAVGMSPAEFWDRDPSLCKAYREAWRMRVANLNAEQWRMGAYVYNAAGMALASVLDEKGEHPYLEEPFRLDGEEEREEEKVPAGVAYLREYTARRKAARKRREMGGQD